MSSLHNMFGKHWAAKSSNSVLTITMPPSHKNEAGGAPDQDNDQMMAMMKEMFKDMRVSFTVDVQGAIDAPRWRVEIGDWGLRHETRFEESIVDGLAARGHRLTATSPYDMGMGHAHAIRIEADGLAAASDPRSEGAAVGR